MEARNAPAPTPATHYAVRRPKWFSDAIKWIDTAKKDLERGDRVDATDSLRMAANAIRRGMPAAMKGPRA